MATTILVKKPVRDEAAEQKRKILRSVAANFSKKKKSRSLKVPVGDIATSMQEAFSDSMSDVENVVEAYLSEVQVHGPSSVGALELRKRLTNLTKSFLAAEKFSKVIVGMTLSPIKETMSVKAFENHCLENFNITMKTADIYIIIYEALFSGKYLYQLPPQYNWFSLSTKNLETAARLVMTGNFTEDNAEILFAPAGDWQAKRDRIRADNPAIVERSSNRLAAANGGVDPTPIEKAMTGMKRLNKASKFWVNSSGDLMDGHKRFGTLLLTPDQPAEVRILAEEARDALNDYFQSRGRRPETTDAY